MESCRWCGKELRDVTDPSFGPPPPTRWVHDAGGHEICWPDKQGSPRAAPEPPPEPRVPLTHEEIEEMLADWVGRAETAFDRLQRQASLNLIRFALRTKPMERVMAAEPEGPTVTLRVHGAD